MISRIKLSHQCLEHACFSSYSSKIMLYNNYIYFFTLEIFVLLLMAKIILAKLCKQNAELYQNTFCTLLASHKKIKLNIWKEKCSESGIVSFYLFPKGKIVFQPHPIMNLKFVNSYWNITNPKAVFSALAIAIIKRSFIQRSSSNILVTFGKMMHLLRSCKKSTFAYRF